MIKIKLFSHIKKIFHIKKILNKEKSISISEPKFWDSIGINPFHYVNADEALRNSDIFSLISQLSADLAITKYNTDIERVQYFINNPSNMTNGHAFWQSMFAQMLLSGEAFAYRWRNANAVDLYWEYLRPSQVEPMKLLDGSGLVYNINFDEPNIGRMQNVPSADLIHIRLMSKNGGLTGISPLDSLVNELNIKKASNDLTLNALRTTVTSNGILEIPKGGDVQTKDKIALSQSFLEQVKDPNSGPIVLDDLYNYIPLEVKSDTANLLKQTDWTGTQIAKVYGVPDSYLNGQGDQQSSITQLQGMYANALNRYAQAVAAELEDKLKLTINVNLRPALDPSGNNHATKIEDLTKAGILKSDQAIWLLIEDGFLPKNLPASQE